MPRNGFSNFCTNKTVSFWLYIIIYMKNFKYAYANIQSTLPSKNQMLNFYQTDKLWQKMLYTCNTILLKIQLVIRYELQQHLDNFEKLAPIVHVHKAIIKDSVNLVNPKTCNLVSIRSTSTRE